MSAEIDARPDPVSQMQDEIQRLKQEIDGLKRLLGLGPAESTVTRKRLGLLNTEGLFIFPPDGEHPDEADLKLFATGDGGMIMFCNGPSHSLMTLFCDENGGHVQINGRGADQMVKLWVEDGSGLVGVYAKDHKGIAGLKVQPTGGVAVVQGPDGNVLGLMRCAEHGGEVFAFGKDDKSRVRLWNDEFGGAVTVISKAGGAKAHVRALADGGFFSASNAQGITSFIACAGSPCGRIALGNDQRQYPVTLWADEHGGIIDVSTHEGKGHARLSMFNQAGRVELSGPEHSQAELNIDKDGGQLMLSDNAGNWVVAAGACPQGGHVLFQGKDNQLAGLFGMGSDGPTLELTRGEKQSHVHLGTTEHGGLIRVLGNDGQVRAAMSVIESGGHVCVFNDDRQMQASMHSLPTGGVFMAHGFTGQPRATLGAEEGGGKIALLDYQGVGRVGIMATKKRGTIALLDGDTILIAIDADQDGNRLTMLGPNQEPCVHIATSEDGGLVHVFDTDGEVQGSLPM